MGEFLTRDVGIYASPEVALRFSVEQEADFAVLPVIATRFAKKVAKKLANFVGFIAWGTVFCLDSPTLSGHRSKLQIRKGTRLATFVVDLPYQQVAVLDLLQGANEAINKALFMRLVRHSHSFLIRLLHAT